jgi:AAA15 family ATPase/GTPase
MIKRIQILHYRGIRYSDVRLNRFNIFIGPNGSDKSTFIDVINLWKDVMDDGIFKVIFDR